MNSVTQQDYYPFGMNMPGRQYTSASYRYGFNGKEKDDEVKSITGSSYDFGARIFDPRVGRFLSIDPLFKKFSELTPYQFAANSPIALIDYHGESPKNPTTIAQERQKLNDGKEANRFMLIVYVDQPKAGSDKYKTGTDVGHTFIQIVKYNKDGTTASTTIGFYPSETVTPYDQSSPGEFGDDAGHDYDQAVYKGVTATQVNNILALAEEFESREYEVCDENCTDFAIEAAAKGGLILPDPQQEITIPGGPLRSNTYKMASTPAAIGQAIIAQKSEIEKQGAAVIISPKDDSRQAVDRNPKKDEKPKSK